MLHVKYLDQATIRSWLGSNDWVPGSSTWPNLLPVPPLAISLVNPSISHRPSKNFKAPAAYQHSAVCFCLPHSWCWWARL